MTEIVVMTSNVGNGRARPEDLIPAFANSGADLIAIQELSEHQAAAIAADLEQQFPHQAVFPGGFAGKAVLSRFPITTSEQLHLSPHRPDLHAVVQINGAEIAFLVAHPIPPKLSWAGLRFDGETWSQIRTLADMAVENPPAVLLGDFNMADWWGEYAYIRTAGLKDAFAVAGPKRGSTLPRRIGPWKRFTSLNRALSGLPLFPVLRVDYIWYTEPLHCQEAWIGDDTGSDHLPVLARLAL
ncbi:MAG: endonuclease/exonuclease/phosphatase family protein [Anaerolineales bacterium]|nr:endonuclease/exonuclease/phosphatase family protein [Anaerolineales bacterium]